MKRALLAAAILAVLVTPALAINQNVGCGLGSLLWSELGRDSSGAPLLFQVLEATTNGTFGSQTFGITTGTSNCSRPSALVQNEKLQEFVLKNMDSLAKDIAAGQGEYLDTCAELIGIPVSERAAFAEKLQRNFASIYSSANVEMAQVVDAISAIR